MVGRIIPKQVEVVLVVNAFLVELRKDQRKPTVVRHRGRKDASRRKHAKRPIVVMRSDADLLDD